MIELADDEAVGDGWDTMRTPGGLSARHPATGDVWHYCAKINRWKNGDQVVEKLEVFR